MNYIKSIDPNNTEVINLDRVASFEKHTDASTWSILFDFSEDYDFTWVYADEKVCDEDMKRIEAIALAPTPFGSLFGTKLFMDESKTPKCTGDASCVYRSCTPF